MSQFQNSKTIVLLFLLTLVTLPFDNTMADSKSPLTFKYTPKEIREFCDRSMSKLNGQLKKLTEVAPNQETFKNTVGALEEALTELSNSVSPVTFLKDVSTDSAVREVAAECDTKIQKLFIDIYARPDLFRPLKAYQEKRETLDPVDAKLLEEHFSTFIRNGLALPEKQQREFLEKKKTLVEVQEAYNKRLGDWKDELQVSEKELAGLPDDYIRNLEKTADGKFRIPLDYPHYFTFMENGRNAETRKKLEFKFSNRGGEENKELLEKAIRLRAELAHLLGYKTHADFVLERRMAKNPQQVAAFLDRLQEKLVPKGKENLQELLEAKRFELKDPKIEEIYSWDWRYYENQLRRTKYQVDAQLVREYFPLDVVLKGMFEIYQTLLNVHFIEVKNANVWHPSVRLYRVERDKKTAAYFYMDLFPREGKYGHAAAFQLVSGYEQPNGAYQLPVASIVANFDAPTPKHASLLPHDTVETLFHEFGHIMHQTLTGAKYGTFSGSNVKTDFVEAPSQMLENWVWQRVPLEKLSAYYKDHTKKLPPELIEKMVKAKLLNVGIRYLRQLSFAKIDLAYHTADHVDSTAIYRNMSRDVMLIPIPDNTLPQSSFGHLMGGYDAGYYGYLWSEVYAEDMFTRFEKEGYLNPKTGGDYVHWILKPGGTQDPMALIQGFLGRAPNEKAFFKFLGLDDTNAVTQAK